MAEFDGGALTSDAGGLLLGAADRRLDLVGRLAGCFRDARDPRFVEHSVATLVGQRVFGIALGYEDLNDHDELRHDPVMAVLAGKLEARRERLRAGGGQVDAEPAGAVAPGATRYHKISHEPAAIEALFVDLFLEAHAKAPKEIILDLDATDDPLHGHQEGRFFHGYYDGYCYLPLYVFCGRHLLAAKLRPSNIDASAGSVEEVARIVAPDPGALAEDAHPPARRFRLRPRGADGVVRSEPGRLRVRPRAQRPAGRGDRRRTACRPRRRPPRPASPRAASRTSATRRSTAGRAGAG